MKKTIHLIRGAQDVSYGEFQKDALELSTKVSMQGGIHQAKVNLTVEKPPLSIIPFSKQKIAVLSYHHEEGVPTNPESVSGYIGSYEVEEALPVAYDFNFKPGEAVPGLGLLTLFSKKPGIDYDDFINRWHNGHTPMSLRLHPLWNYNRNVVKSRTPQESEPWDGIVEEHFRTSRELLNPFVFFGNSWKMPYHMWEVYNDTSGFLDYKTMETFLTREYFTKLLPQKD